MVWTVRASVNCVRDFAGVCESCFVDGDSYAMGRSCEFPAAELIEVVEVAWVGFGGAVWVEDGDTVGFESQQREAHGHTVIFVRMDTGWLWGSGVDGEPVGMFFGVDAGASKFVDDGCNSICFLVPHVFDVTDACG